MHLIRFIFFALLTLTILQGCQKEESDSSTPPVTPIALPVANFKVVNDNCTVPCAVTFTNTSTNAKAYSWNFGDDTPVSTDLSPSHTYTRAGTYTVVLTATSASGTNTHNAQVTIAEAPYFIRYQVNAIPIEASVLAATRQAESRPNTLTFQGSGLNGNNPSLRLQVAESFIGWIPGINVYFSAISSSGFVMEYIDVTGQVYTSLNSQEESHCFFSALSYTKDGEIAGIFSGPLQSAAGNTVRIKEGKFKLKISN